jgi:predicted CopG family antitoxin
MNTGMAVTRITVSEEAYRALAAVKLESEKLQ